MEDTIHGLFMTVVIVAPIIGFLLIIRQIIMNWDVIRERFGKVFFATIMICMALGTISYFRHDYEFIKEGNTIYRLNHRNGEVYRHHTGEYPDNWKKTTYN